MSNPLHYDPTLRAEVYHSFVEEVKRDNAAFEAASDAEKRVVIAKDALRHMQVGIFEPETMSYGTGILPFTDEPQELRAALLEEVPVCQACARGGLVFSTIMRRNSIEDTHFRGDMELAEFPLEMLEDIESAFEASQMWSSERYTVAEGEKLYESVLDWRTALMDANRTIPYFLPSAYRFERVMWWIIDHAGDFNLEDFLGAEIPLLQEMTVAAKEGES